MVWGVRVGLIGLVCFGCAAESPVAPSVPRETEFSLWGTVQDTAFRPIAGVVVEVLDRGMGVSALTDSTGRFGLPGSGARFWPAPRTDRFFGGVAGSSVRFIMDEGDGLAVVEELAPSQSLALYGEADGEIDGSAIAGSFSGSFDYCSDSGSPPVGSLRCTATPVRCRSSNHRLTLIRR